MIEFQKAQCFFMLAINIAAQVNRGVGGFQPNSLQQLYNNYVFIKAISISGYLPITLILFVLHTVDMVSWYLIILSVLTVAVSVATLVDIGNFAPTQADMDYLSQQAAASGTPECGNRDLLVYCLNPLGNSYGVSQDGDVEGDPTTGAFSILAFCLFVLVLLILEQAGVFKKLSSLQTSARLSKTQKFLITNFVNIRGFQLLLAISTLVSLETGESSKRTSYTMLISERTFRLLFLCHPPFLSIIHFHYIGPPLQTS